MKPRVLILIAQYHPGYKSGGPVRSTINLVDQLHEYFDFRIITSDRDVGDDATFPGIDVDHWSASGTSLVRYISPKNQTLKRLASEISAVQHDLIYFNSFFSKNFTILPLVARRLGMIPRRPIILAPRGELAEGALALKRPKKLAWMKVGGALGLFDHLIWQASSNYERDDIQAAMKKRALDVAIVRNLPTLPTGDVEYQPRVPGAPLRVLSVSRISAKKNLAYALRVLSQVRSDLIFSIYGPREDPKYIQLCESIVRALPSHVKVNWHGVLKPEEIPGIMARNDLFFLPTLNENYGHVIAEALSVGTPVLISDKTPWRELEARGVGHDLSLADEAAFAARIDEFASATPVSALKQRNLARAFFRESVQSHIKDVEDQKALFLRAVRGG